VRLLDQDGEMVGVIELDDAKRRAYDLGLDLVEI
jgi:translation initiation factor IF-3